MPKEQNTKTLTY